MFLPLFFGKTPAPLSHEDKAKRRVWVRDGVRAVIITLLVFFFIGYGVFAYPRMTYLQAAVVGQAKQMIRMENENQRLKSELERLKTDKGCPPWAGGVRMAPPPPPA